MSFCPARSGFVECRHEVCETEHCMMLHHPPINDLAGQSAVHFVGFRGEEYHSAVKVFGLPDFVHRVWDRRAEIEVASNDCVVFAKYHNTTPSQYSFDDSNQPDDPAAKERLTSK